MKNVISEDTSKRITALRFLLAVLVVFIHNNYTLKGIAETIAAGGDGILFNQNAFGKWVQLFISDGIARCAVPLFFLFAAYLQAKKNDPYPALLKKRARSLLVPYVLWIGIYLCYTIFGKLLIAKLMPEVLVHPDKTVFSWNFTDWFARIFGYGKWLGVLPDNNPGAAGQFWFVRDLMILVVCSPLLVRLVRKFPVGFFALVSLLYAFSVTVYFVEIPALFFYVAGLYWGIYDIPLLEKIDHITYVECIALFLITCVSACGFLGLESMMFLCMTVASCVLMLKFSAVIVRHEKAFKIASYFAGFSFFLYAIHMPALNELLRRIWLHFFPMKNAFFCLFEYFGVTALTIVIGTGIGIALKKICPPLFALLNGGRK